MNIKKQSIAKPNLRNIGRYLARRMNRCSKITTHSKFKFSRIHRKRNLNIALTSLIIVALVVGVLLPAITVRASQTMTWSSNADFTNNQISKCQATTLDNLVVSGANYSDATCAAIGSDASLILAPDELNKQSIKSIAAGNVHSLALKNDSTVGSWGENGYGALGDGTNTGSNIPVQVKDSTGTGFLSGISAIAAGDARSLALKSDGTVWAWGENGYGGLGNGTNTSSNIPVQVKDSTGTGFLSGISAIATGSYHSLALKSDGTVWAWGYDGTGALGDGTNTSSNIPVQVKDSTGTGFLSGISAIATGSYDSLALHSDGTVWAWGNNSNGGLGNGTNTGSNIPVQVKDSTGTGFLSGISAIVSRGDDSLALHSDGTVWAWGNNSNGQLGDSTTSNRYIPVQVKDSTGTGFLSGISAIAASALHSLALKSDGTVWAWGWNYRGQFGDGTNTSSNIPVQVKDSTGTGFLSGISAIAANFYNSLALKNDGTLWAWGWNNYGELGSGDNTQHNTPNQVLGSVNYLSGFVSSGSLSGIVLDVGAGNRTKWQAVDWQTDALPAGASISFIARTSNDGTNWSDWSSPFIQASAGSTTGTGALTSLSISRYIEMKANLATTDNLVSPTLNDFSLSYINDTDRPDVNAANVSMSNKLGDAPIADSSWSNTKDPYFSWDNGADAAGGVGLQGYCLYLGHDNTADVIQTKGILGASPLDAGGVCQYTVDANHLDLGVAGALATPLATANEPYYLLVKAIDYAGNIYAGPAAQYALRYDDVAPTNPAFISAPSQFVASKDVTLTWPVAGNQSAADGNSGVAGLQYKIGVDGIWYGDAHNGKQDSSDLLANDGSYKTDPTIDYPLLKEGNNIVYFRTIDNAGNSSVSYDTAVIKINTSSPTPPQNVTATPPTNDKNSFAFSWHAPTSFVGPVNALTYCYTVNTLPTANTCAFTQAGATSLSADAFATQPGENIFYVVAKDEAGNINYDTYGSTTFTANTPAPGLPLNLEIADISTKAAKIWKLAFSWTAPVDVGAGISKYVIFRSTNGVSYTQLATTGGLSYVDSSLSQIDYYYKVKACDSANNCGAFAELLKPIQPTGRFTDPPELTNNVSVQVSTRKATFNWATDRVSDSRIQYGTKSGVYLPGELTVSDPSKMHAVDLSGLEAGTTYYYKAKWTDEDGNTGVSTELSFTTLPAPVVKDVKVIKTSLNSALIQFTSTDATKVDLVYGKTEGFGGIKSVNTSRSESTYTVELDGLDDGASYVYKLSTYDNDKNKYDSYRIDSFTTPARPRISNLRFQPVTGEPTSTQKVTWTTNVPTTSTVTYGKITANGSDIYSSDITTEHAITIRGLEDDSQYFLLAQSRDVDGNLAIGERQIFKTALDTRPPKITGTRIETVVKGYGSEARGQIVVSWKTDEPASSQVAYADGSGGSNYVNKTAEDMRLTTDHVVIISDLAVSKVYHLQPISNDRARNATLGSDQSAIIGRASESVLNIILNSLTRIFGL